MNSDLVSQLHKSAQTAIELGNIKKAKKNFEKIIEILKENKDYNALIVNNKKKN